MTESLPTSPLACVILAAGQGTRMRSDMPKVLHHIAGLPLISHVIKACSALSPEKTVVVVSPENDLVGREVSPTPCALQEKPLGTGDAAKAARELLKDFSGEIIILFGDTPLITKESLQALRDKRAATGASIVVAGFTPKNPSGYGRLILGSDGQLLEIVEDKDATPEQQKIKLCNGGIMLFEADKLWPLLDKLNNNNAKAEYYLTDCVKFAKEQGLVTTVTEFPEEDIMGVNTRVDLAQAEKIMQNRLRHRAMMDGVTFVDPDTVYISHDTIFGSDVIVGPHVVFAQGVRISDGVEIRSFCHIAGTRIETGAIVGPFARLRPDTFIGSATRIGNFVEVKNSEIGAGAKVNHLTYLGDATIGSRANIGAGTITCNFDGFTKSRTEIGAGAFIGSNTALVAPVKVGSGAYVGAGSVITENVKSDALSVSRGKQTSIDDWARRYRDEREKEKQE